MFVPQFFLRDRATVCYTKQRTEKCTAVYAHGFRAQNKFPIKVP